MDFSHLALPVEAAMRATHATALAAYRSAPAPERFKDDGTHVTDLDLLLEGVLAKALLPLDEAFGLVSEEAGEIRSGSPTWHLDPVDGTANFARRIGIFGSQVVLLEGTEPLFAAIYEPLADVFTWAARGAGTWREGLRVRIPERAPKDAFVTFDISRRGLLQEHPGLITAIRQGCYRARALGSIAIQLRDVATGAADGFLGGRPYKTPLHDMAPGTLLIREAGGIVSDSRGGDPLIDRKTMVAGAPPVHDWLCELLASLA
jgi:myo-inositol-1(or 4)-monophosphatase